MSLLLDGQRGMKMTVSLSAVNLEIVDSAWLFTTSLFFRNALQSIIVQALHRRANPS